jgi:SAM-dependent methyltransferase
VSDDPRFVVERGYDAIAERYASWGGTEPQGAKRLYLDEALRRAPSGGRLLDLGCGTGQQVTQHLAATTRTIGIDLSYRSLSIAAANLPHASFVQADMATVAFRPDVFDGVVAFFSMIHVPRGRHENVLRSIHSWLRPDGFLIVTMHSGEGVDGDGEFLGVPMFWSGWNADRNVDLVREAGFTVVSAIDHVEDEDGSLVSHRWIVATAR